MSDSVNKKKSANYYDDDKEERSFSFRSLGILRKVSRKGSDRPEQDKTGGDGNKDGPLPPKASGSVQKDSTRIPTEDKKKDRALRKKLMGFASALPFSKPVANNKTNKDDGKDAKKVKEPKDTDSKEGGEQDKSKEADAKKEKDNSNEHVEDDDKTEDSETVDKEKGKDNDDDTDTQSPKSKEAESETDAEKNAEAEREKAEADANLEREQAEAEEAEEAEKLAEEAEREMAEKLKKAAKAKKVAWTKQEKEQPPFGSRVKSGELTMQAKAKVVVTYPDLAIARPSAGGVNDKAHNLIHCGLNSIKAEMIDLNSMVVIMQENVRNLTHSTVEKFFDWFEPFQTYLERYMTVEEEFLILPVEARLPGGLKGDIKPSGRMLLRGTIQRMLCDLIDLQDIFKPYIPAGEKLPTLAEAVQELTEHIVKYWGEIGRVLPDLMAQRMGKKGEIDKMRLKMTRHLVKYVGYKDFLCVYTRWMGAAELLEWKKNVLLRCDYKFFSYTQWDKDMENIHYYIPAEFGDILLEEQLEGERLAHENKADFERAQAQRAQMEVLDEEYDEDLEEYDGDEDEDEGRSSRRVTSSRKQAA